MDGNILVTRNDYAHDRLTHTHLQYTINYHPFGVGSVGPGADKILEASGCI